MNPGCGGYLAYPYSRLSARIQHKISMTLLGPHPNNPSRPLPSTSATRAVRTGSCQHGPASVLPKSGSCAVWDGEEN